MPLFDYPASPQNFGEFAVWANSVTGNMAGPIMLVVIFAISFLSMKANTTQEAFTGSSFITSLASYGFYLIGLVEPVAILVPTFMFAVSLILLRSNMS